MSDYQLEEEDSTKETALNWNRSCCQHSLLIKDMKVFLHANNAAVRQSLV